VFRLEAGVGFGSGPGGFTKVEVRPGFGSGDVSVRLFCIRSG